MNYSIKKAFVSVVMIAGAGIGMPSVGIADSGKVINLGAPMSLTGQYRINGKHAKKGYETAKKIINENGGISIGGVKHKISIKYYDDESNPAIAAKFAKRLITKDKVNFLLGPYGTSTTAAVAPVAEKYKMPFVQGNGASLSLFDKGYKYMFAVLSSADKYLSEAINLAAEQARKNNAEPSTLKVAIAVENDAFSSDLRNGVIADARKYGMKVVVDEKLPRDFKDMTFILDKVKKEKPDIIFIDLKLPGIDGDEILKRIQKIHPKGKAIMITAFKDEGQTKKRLLEAGVYAYFEKPIASFKELEEVDIITQVTTTQNL